MAKENNSLEFKNFRLHSDNTLMQLKKKELISYIHMLYHNWSACDERCENIRKYAEKLSSPKPYAFEELHEDMWVWDDKNKDFKQISRSIKENQEIWYYGVYDEYILGKFEENRFYPPSKVNLGKQ